MDSLLSNLKISVPEKIYVKDPESSTLGKRIIEHSILLIDDIGFDSFTFKKLGQLIGSNESSIYRYFESKHNLLLYLSSWYWAWIEYQLVFETHSLNPSEKLEKAIEIVTRSIKVDSKFSHINETILNKIIVNENSKSFLTKEVDQENKEGFFIIYKRIVHRLRDMIIAINPDYKFASSLGSTILESGLHQHFLKDHFKTITDCNASITPTSFIKNLVLNTLKS
ncbi:TetR/AcrR family transcriptional regulator [Algibacter amylolyticus]|uniref:TetR/AcrR family transcriptional regulator n=1 Tax=Algibacter amylolyticus TaxID=1608400 RepID=A0A5M7B1X4_9FLAO|nr:TetR/AcrR family transcriptional regulator [Algibacter amylolyticus]KAA5823459.1 TetR/AcrR family transcriptional regulator [Algibacter amylolyticus]MBB5267609.1 AcrR family transcriptional regulator [Algibacter amylolyticus]TSJ73947.1 TetR/AcrR family transcriptional regulator [Algibacter amylolyticus]